jgi:hypothetical protein
MTARRLIWLLLVVWFAVYAWSVLSYFLMPASGDGFTRGLNRISGFITWQMVAAGVAVAIWITGRGFAVGSRTRRISRGPALFAFLPILGLILVIAYVQIARWTADPIPASTPRMPVTQPTN